jgi:hypothetical protein
LILINSYTPVLDLIKELFEEIERLRRKQPQVKMNY